MRLLITGMAGFIGSHLAEAAIAAGHEVVGIDLLTYAGRSANLRDGVELIRGDICDRLMVDAVLERVLPDAVMHLAAESHVGRSIDCRDEFLRTNVVGTNVLLEAALSYWRGLGRPAGFRFLHVSTDEVYGSLGPHDAPWTEDSPYAPNNPYAASKAASDHLVRSYWHTFGLPVITTHSSNNYGPRQHWEKLIPRLVRQLMDGGPMTIHGDGLNIRDWLHVEDHCAGLLAALRYGREGKVYNFGGECERTNLHIARAVSAIVTPAPWASIALTEDRPGNDRRYASCITKARTDLYWQPGPAIEQRLGETVRWYLSNPTYELGYGH